MKAVDVAKLDPKMNENLLVERDPPRNRRDMCLGAKELHMTEAAVMLAYGMHLLRTIPGLRCIEIHPDGEHGKKFDIAGWLSGQDFVKKEGFGTTSYGGAYVRGEQQVLVKLTPGKGDVTAHSEAATIRAECKGGIVNTKHAGQISKLRRGLCEAIGLLMASPRAGRQVAVVPLTKVTLGLAQKLALRAKGAGIEIALVDGTGNVRELGSDVAGN